MIRNWLLLAVPVAVLGTVVLGLSQCAVAEVVVRLAAWMCSRDCQQRCRKREEWLCHLEDMRPSERPAHAASLLWLALRSIPLQVSLEGRRRNSYSEILTVLVVDFHKLLGGMRLSRSFVKLWRVMLFVGPGMATKVAKWRFSHFPDCGDDDPEGRETAAAMEFSMEVLQHLWREMEPADLGEIASKVRR